MNRTPLLVAAVAVLAAGPAPAGAEPYRDSGLSCGFAGSRPVLDGRPLGPVVGTVWGGPWYVADAPPASEVTLTCRVEVELDDGTRQPVATVSGTSVAGVAVVPPTATTFDPGSTANTNIWVCTEVTVYDPLATPPFYHRQIDADGDPSNGAQCAKTEADRSDYVYIWAKPPHWNEVGNAFCIWLNHGIGPTVLPPPLPTIPAPPERYCVPG